MAKGKQSYSRGPSNLVTIIIVVIIFAIGYYMSQTEEDSYADCLTTVPEAAQDVIKQSKVNTKKVDFRYHNETTTADTDTSEVMFEILAEAAVPTENPDEGDYYTLRVKMPENAEDIVCLTFDKKDGTQTFYYTIRPQYLTTKAQEETFARSAAAITEALKLDGKSDAEKAKAIYAYITEKVAYTNEPNEDAKAASYLSACGADANGKAASAGFASFFYYLAKAEGLECRIVVGDNHTYNLVWIDGVCYIADAAWDAGNAESAWECFLVGTDDYQASFEKAEEVDVSESLRHNADGVEISAASFK